MAEKQTLPEGWRWVRLGEVCEKPEYGYTASADDKPVGPRLLRITDIQNGRVEWDRVPYCRIENENDKYLNLGDILIARTGGTTGKSYLISDLPHKTVFASYLIRVRTKPDLIPEYLYLFLQTAMYWKQVEAHKRGGAQPNMNATLLSNIVLPFPSLSEQKRITAKLQELMHEVERARAACEKELEVINALPQSILRKAFKGEL
jgi:type I restriction enzyme S subunit